MQISICIPTRNRAVYLSRCLDHLLTFSQLDFEVVIGDNASTDDTKTTVERYADRFPHFTYHRHEQDIGFARNMDAILRLARGKFVYIHSDDDMVFENALITMRNILEENPAAVSVTGRYENVEKPEIGKDFAYPNVDGFRIAQADFSGWFNALARNLTLCDGQPLMRREAFQRHCWYHDRGFALGPLHTQLLATGDLVFIEQPVFQHCRNADSLSMRMTEPWFHDFCHADIELMCSIAAKPAPPETVEALRLSILRMIYLHSVRMARLKGAPALMWHFLRRAKAVGGIDEACLAQCERDLLATVALLRLITIIEDTGSHSLAVEEGPIMDAVCNQLGSLLARPLSVTRFTGAPLPEGVLCLLEAFDPQRAASLHAGTIVAYLDIVETCRLTTHPIQISAESGRLAVHFTSQSGSTLLNESSPGYSIMMETYAAAGDA